jgi:PAS domain S-box-containing protein
MATNNPLGDVLIDRLRSDQELYELWSRLPVQGCIMRELSSPHRTWADAPFWQALGYPRTQLPLPGSDWAAHFSHEGRAFLQQQAPGRWVHCAELRDRAGQTVRWQVHSYVSLSSSPPGDVQVLLCCAALPHSLTQRLPQIGLDPAQVLAALGHAVIVLDQNQHVAYWNAAAEQLYGWKAGEVLGKSLRGKTTLPQEGAYTPRTSSEIMDALKKGLPWQGEFWLQKKDGTPFPVLVDNQPLFDHSDRLRGYVGLSVEISKQKQTERDLREVTQRLQLATETAEVGIWQLDLDTGELHWNQQLFAIHEVDPHEFRKDVDAWRRQVYPEDLAPADAELQRIMQGETVKDVRFRIRTPSGQIKQICASGAPMYDLKGKLVKLIGINLDITHLVDLEEKAELLQELERKTRELETFAYIISHDLREPIRTLNAYSQFLLKDEKSQFSEEAVEFAQFLQGASQRLNKRIQALVDYHRLGLDRVIEVIDLQALVATVVRELKAQMEDTQGSITLRELPTMQGYPVELHLLFQNLLSNALKFHRPDTPPRIEISACADLSRYTVEVKDNGIGIAPEYQERIFQMFQRLHKQGTYQGSGIGLAYVKKIVELHGGDIWVQSTPGQGSTFVFTLDAQLS